MNISLVESSESRIPIFYDIYPWSVMNATTVRDTMDIPKSPSVNDLEFIMDRGMISSPNLKYMLDNDVGFIMPVSYSGNDV